MVFIRTSSYLYVKCFDQMPTAPYFPFSQLLTLAFPPVFGIGDLKEVCSGKKPPSLMQSVPIYSCVNGARDFRSCRFHLLDLHVTLQLTTRFNVFKIL